MSQRINDEINLEGLKWGGREVSPLELWRYYYQTGVLFHNGGVLPDTNEFGIEFVDASTPAGMQRFIDEFHRVQPGLRGRVRENFMQITRQINFINFHLPSCGEDLSGMTDECKKMLLDTITDPTLRKEILS